MCNPAAFLIVTTLVSAGVSAYSQDQQGKQQESWANYQAAQGEADANAERGAAQVEAERIRKAGKRAQSEARAGLAASGVDLGSESAVRIDQEIGRGAEEDALLTIAGGNDTSARLRAGAAADRIRGSQAAGAGRLGAASSLIAGASSAAGNWKTMKAGK